MPFCIFCKKPLDAEPGSDNEEHVDSFVIRGNLHTHTSGTDGNHSLAQMAEAAEKWRYEYLAVTDAHSLAHLCNIDYGEEMVRACRIPAKMVLNTMGCKELVSFFKNQREKPESPAGESVQDMKKDFSHYFGNNPAIIQGKKTVIGIDLTGTEEKASGWSYLAGRQAQCRRIRTNQEIIDSIKQLKPDIVSIDSPLTYPRGRCCADKNCKCSRYGIMRNSEHLLRHLGITVYPCLIDSIL